MQWLPFILSYSVYGLLLVFLAVLAAIWLIIHVEKSTQLNWLKLIIVIIFICIAIGFGFQLILVGQGV